MSRYDADPWSDPTFDPEDDVVEDEFAGFNIVDDFDAPNEDLPDAPWSDCQESVSRALATIDDGLGETTGRSLIDADAMTDLLLDLRTILAP